MGNRGSSAVDSAKGTSSMSSDDATVSPHVQATHNRRHADFHGVSLVPCRHCVGRRMHAHERGRLNQCLGEVPQIGVMLEAEQVAVRTGDLYGTSSFNRKRVPDPSRFRIDKRLQCIPQHSQQSGHQFLWRMLTNGHAHVPAFRSPVRTLRTTGSLLRPEAFLFSIHRQAKTERTRDTRRQSASSPGLRSGPQSQIQVALALIRHDTLRTTEDERRAILRGRRMDEKMVLWIGRTVADARRRAL